MKTIALVPFKCFTRAKRRLRSVYADAEVEALGRAMLEDVLAALLAAPSLAAVQVLTDDEEVGRVAEQAGATLELYKPDPGLNPVLERAGAAALRRGFDASLVVLGDVPGLHADDVEAVVRAGEEHAVVIVPSRDGGTTLLFRRPPQVIPASFGGASAAAHEAGARAAGISPCCLDLDERVHLDLDTPEDAERLLASPAPSRTRALLERLRR